MGTFRQRRGTINSLVIDPLLSPKNFFELLSVKFFCSKWKPVRPKPRKDEVLDSTIRRSVEFFSHLDESHGPPRYYYSPFSPEWEDYLFLSSVSMASGEDTVGKSRQFLQRPDALPVESPHVRKGEKVTSLYGDLQEEVCPLTGRDLRGGCAPPRAPGTPPEGGCLRSPQ